MSHVDVLIIGLASWRIASLLVTEEGPGLVFMRLRTMVGVLEGPGEQSSGFLPLVFSCIWCMSIWTTLLAAAIWYLEPVAVMICAAMTVALIPEALHGGSQHRN